MAEETRAESEDQIAAMLDDCVRMQLVSDVPVGVFLSGGIDSSSLVGHHETRRHSAEHFFYRISRGGLFRGRVFARHRTNIFAPIITK